MAEKLHNHNARNAKPNRALDVVLGLVLKVPAANGLNKNGLHVPFQSFRINSMKSTTGKSLTQKDIFYASTDTHVTV
jgi:hypothetical protein